MRGAAEHFEDDVSTKIPGAALGMNFELFAMPALGKSTDDFSGAGNV